jgi:glycerol kinase
VVCNPDGDRKVLPGYLQTLVWQDRAGCTHLACEGTLNSIAAALKPYPADACRAADLAADDIFCLAEPSGLGAPYFRGDLGIVFSESVEHLPQQRIATLLLEAIIFRVARILEDFQQAFGIERAYLSGGLSGHDCLQQGIAQCAPMTIYHLLQVDGSLSGAARLAAGMAEAGPRQARRVAPVPGPAMREKYLRWKAWLDQLLSA